jgi:hypothetical protein
MSLQFRESHVLDRLEKELEQQIDDNKSLENKAQFSLGSISIILALLAGFNSSTSQASQTLIIIGIIMYILLFLVALYIISPEVWQDGSIKSPTDPLEDPDYVQQMIGSYEAAIKTNRKRIRLKVNLVRLMILLNGISFLSVVVAIALG